MVLDLDSTDREQYTRTRSYMGQPFIFNMIHTFGGQLALFGRNSRINSRPFQARQMANSSLVGANRELIFTTVIYFNECFLLLIASDIFFLA